MGMRLHSPVRRGRPRGHKISQSFNRRAFRQLSLSFLFLISSLTFARSYNAMFAFFSRKQQQQQQQPVTKVPNLPLSPDPMAVDSEPQQLRTPSPSEAAFNGHRLGLGLGLYPSPSTVIAMSSLPPGHSPSDSSIPIPAAVPPTPEALHSLVTSIPAKTLHTYLLDHIPAAPPDTLAALASFFATLSPPPLLHCVRCHDDYTDIENGDRSCRVPHDDDSAEVEFAGHKRGNSDYETYYHCCGKTVEGEGDLGPPDGWCYEGMHTVSQVNYLSSLASLPVWKALNRIC
jgi:hypothetical protein